MTAHQIIDRLMFLKEKILGWPSNVADGDPDLAFQKLENELQEILASIHQLTETDRQAIQPTVDGFRQAVTERHKATQEKLYSLKGDLTSADQRQRAFRAYGGGT
jgi:hypothetical protein